MSAAATGQSRHFKLLAALVLGMGLGLILHPYAAHPVLVSLNANLLQPLGQIFLRLIFMVVVPLIFSALVLGVHELSQSQGFGKVASRTLGYTLLATTLSVVVGLTLVNTLRPGDGFQITASQQEQMAQNAGSIANIENIAKSSRQKSFAQSVVEMIPRNPLDSAVRALDGEMLPLMVFALIFGVALSLMTRGQPDQESPLIRILDQIFRASMKVIDFAMVLAPYAVFALVFGSVLTFGLGLLKSLLFYVAVVVAGLLIQQFGVYPILLKFLAKISPLWFFKNCQDVCLYAFSTASSNATLPIAIETAENKLKLPPRIARFVLTVGATANQNGTALFEGVTVLFLAQVYGIELTLASQVTVVLMSILAGIGTAGVPGGSLPLIMVLLQSVGIPPEGIGLILGVDRFLDMCRTTLNVSGDLVITALVSQHVDTKAKLT